MHYKYKIYQTEGAFGTTVRHKPEDAFELGQIGEFVYIYAMDITTQPEILEFIPVTLTPEELQELHDQKHLRQSKMTARGRIRGVKDLEDDLTDQKQIIQFMARGFAGLWVSLPQEIKDANPYKANFDLFSTMVGQVNLRLDLEDDQLARITGIINDEQEFATIVEEEYLSKFKGTLAATGEGVLNA